MVSSVFMVMWDIAVVAADAAVIMSITYYYAKRLSSVVLLYTFAEMFCSFIRFITVQLNCSF